MTQRFSEIATGWPVLARIFLPLLGLFVLLGAPPSSHAGPAPSTQAMTELLKQQAARMDVMKNIYLNDRRASVLQAMIATVQDPNARLKLDWNLSKELLRDGKTLESLKLLEQIEASLEGLKVPEQTARLLSLQKIMCHLRHGEQQNCLAHHTIDSCLLPIQGSGVHKLPEGSRNASKLLLQFLDQYPEDLSARWLLTVAAMTLGEYPEGVPERWLIPPKTFASDTEFPRLIDIAPALGLDINDQAGGCIADDFNNDSYLDLMVSAWGTGDQIRYFENDRQGRFTDKTEEAGLIGVTGGLNLIQADFDNDGHLDFLILRGAWSQGKHHMPNSLIRNTGNGRFEDVTKAAGLLSFYPSQTAVWFDYDNDGWLDLFVGNEAWAGQPNPCELFHNNQDGTFSNLTAQCGLDILQYVKGVAAGDFNNDGRPDLYVSIIEGDNRLYRNDGPGSEKDQWTFTDVAPSAGVHEPKVSFPTWFFDYDNDGWEDIFVAGYRLSSVGDVAADYLNLPHAGVRSRLFRNQGDGTFQDVSKQAGVDKLLLAMGCNFGDINTDGYPDFYIGTGDPDFETIIPNRFFLNDGGKRFLDITTSAGVGHLQKGHAVAFADLDNDGDQDIYTVMGGAFTGDIYPNALFLNPGSPTNRWISLQLSGVESNRSAIGTRIAVTVAVDNGPPLTIHRTLNSGGSFGSSPLIQHIGLGQAARIETVKIRWPSGTEQEFQSPELDRYHKLREGDAKLEIIRLNKIDLEKHTQGGSHHSHQPHHSPAPAAKGETSGHSH